MTPIIPNPPPPAGPAPRDWSWGLVTGLILCAVVTIGVLVTHHQNTPGVIATADAGMLLFGLLMMAIGVLLFRRSPHVRALLRLCRDPRGTSHLYISMGAGVVATIVALVVMPQPTALPFIFLIGVPIVGFISLAVLRRMRPT